MHAGPGGTSTVILNPGAVDFKLAGRPRAVQIEKMQWKSPIYPE
jgi:hypothetical protein